MNYGKNFQCENCKQNAQELQNVAENAHNIAQIDGNWHKYVL